MAAPKVLATSSGRRTERNSAKQRLFPDFAERKGETTMSGTAGSTGQLDPGYGQTAVMLAESALAMVHQMSDLPDVYGVVTPASALGMPLLSAFERQGCVLMHRRGEAGFLDRRD